MNQAPTRDEYMFEQHLRDALSDAAGRVAVGGVHPVPAVPGARTAHRLPLLAAAAVLALVAGVVLRADGGRNDGIVTSEGRDNSSSRIVERDVPVPDVPAKLGLYRPVAVPYQDGVFVWGGVADGSRVPGDAASEPITGPGGKGAGALLSAGTWTVAPPGPLTARTAHSMVADGNRIVVVGGASDTTGGGLLSDAAAYTPQTRTWAALPSLPAPRAAATAFSSSGTIVVAGGSTPQATHPSEVLVLRPGAGTWDIVDVGHPVRTAALGDSGHVVLAGGVAGGQVPVSVLDLGDLTVTALPAAPAGGGAQPHMAVAGVDGTTPSVLTGNDDETGAVYTFEDGRWSRTASTPGLNGLRLEATTSPVLWSAKSSWFAVTVTGVHNLSDEVLDTTFVSCATGGEARVGNPPTLGMTGETVALWSDGRCPNTTPSPPRLHLVERSGR